MTCKIDRERDTILSISTNSVIPTIQSSFFDNVLDLMANGGPPS